MPKGYLVANIRVQDKEKFAAFSGSVAAACSLCAHAAAAPRSPLDELRQSGQ